MKTGDAGTRNMNSRDMNFQGMKPVTETILEKYGDIIDLPHHVSQGRPHMTMHQRAAQFAPFAALSGHSQAIRNTARRVEESFEDYCAEDFI